MTNIPELSADFLALLGTNFPAKDILTVPDDCWVNGYDNSRQHVLPEAVTFPTMYEQVLETVKACNCFNAALTARGRGTATTGASVPLKGGIIMAHPEKTP